MLEIHLLQSVPTNRLNTGEDGMPKYTYFGGTRRARLSSQSVKAATRGFMREQGIDMSVRTRHLVNMLHETTGLAKEVIFEILNGMGLKKAEKGSNLTANIISLDKAEIASLKEVLNANKKNLGDNVKKADITVMVDKFENAFDNIQNYDLALYGRMMTANKNFNVDGAASVAHAFSTNAITIQTDFFNAFDDLENRSAHLGERGITNGCFYRYAVVDTSQLIENLQGDVEAAHKALNIFVESFTKALPSGGQNMHAAFTLPSIGIHLRTDVPYNLANAFEKAIGVNRGESLTEKSIEALDSHLKTYDGFYGHDSRVNAHAFNLTGQAFDYLRDNVSPNFQTWLDAVEL